MLRFVLFSLIIFAQAEVKVAGLPSHLPATFPPGAAAPETSEAVQDHDATLKNEPESEGSKVSWIPEDGFGDEIVDAHVRLPFKELCLKYQIYYCYVLFFHM